MPNVRDQVEKAMAKFDFKTNDYVAELTTNKGSIRLKFFPDIAPGHVSNFLALADIGFYNGLTFHRIIKDFMIQGGCPEGTGTGGPGYKIKAEFNDTPHNPGVVSMARSNDPNSAGSQFFICVTKHQDFLDNKYTAFGTTADEESMQIVDAIGKEPTDSGDRPLETVTIEEVAIQTIPKG